MLTHCPGSRKHQTDSTQVCLVEPCTQGHVRQPDHRMKRDAMTLDELQTLIDRMYSKKDEARGVEGTFMWLMEEVGELAAALRESPKEDIAKEFADVLAWLATIANVAGINLTEAVQMKYGKGCPGCSRMVCECSAAEKP